MEEINLDSVPKERIVKLIRQMRNRQISSQNWQLRRMMHRGPKVRSKTRKLELSQAAKRVVHTRVLLNHLGFMATGRFFSDVEDFV